MFGAIRGIRIKSAMIKKKGEQFGVREEVEALCEGALFKGVRADCRHITALNKQAANLSAGVPHRFVGNIQAALQGLTGGRPVKLGGLVAHKNQLACAKSLPRRFSKPLVIELRKDIRSSPADKIAVAKCIAMRTVDELKDVVWPAEDRDEAPHPYHPIHYWRLTNQLSRLIIQTTQRGSMRTHESDIRHEIARD